VLRPRRHPRHVGERQRPHRLVVRRAFGVSCEEAHDFALACCDDHEIVVLRLTLEVVHADVVDDDVAAALFELPHPAVDLHALVDGLGVAVES